MNLKKFRSALLASVAAALMVTSVTSSAYASKSKYSVTEENFTDKLTKNHFLYETPGSFTTRAKTVAGSTWTLADKLLKIEGDDKKKASLRCKTINLGTSTSKDAIQAGIEATIKPYIKYIIALKSTAFEDITENLNAWATSKTGFNFDDKEHNPFSLLSVTIEDEEYAVFNNAMTGMNGADPSVAFFNTFATMAHGKTIAAHVLKMIQDEVRAANQPKSPAPVHSSKETPKKSSKATATPSKGTPSLLKIAQQNASKKASATPIAEVEKEPTSLSTPLPQFQITAPTEVVTTPVQPLSVIPTGGAQLLADAFGESSSSDDDQLQTALDTTTQAQVTFIPQIQIPTPSPKKQATPQPTVKATTSSAKPKAFVVVQQTQEEIEEAIGDLTSAKYPGLAMVLKNDEGILTLAKDILSEYENDTYLTLNRVKEKLKTLNTQQESVNYGDLSAHTELFTPSMFDDAAQEAFEAFSEAAENGTILTRHTSRDGIVFVNKNNGQLLVSDNGKLFDVATMGKALEDQRNEIQRKALESLHQKSKQLQEDYAGILQADHILDELYNSNRDTYNFVKEAIQEAEESNSTFSFAKILDDKLRAEVLSK